jgi:hypothetical protein
MPTRLCLKGRSSATTKTHLIPISLHLEGPSPFLVGLLFCANRDYAGHVELCGIGVLSHPVVGKEPADSYIRGSTRQGSRLAHTSISVIKATTSLFVCVSILRTGRPRSCSHLWTVRTLLPRWQAICFQPDRTAGADFPGDSSAIIPRLENWSL